MTLKYKLLGKPGNVEEFLDKLQKEGIKQVKLYSEVGYHTFELPFPGDPASFFLVFESPDGKVKYRKEVTAYFPFMGEEFERDVYREARKWSEELKRRGFEVTLKPPIFLQESQY